MNQALPNHIFSSLPQAYLVGGSVRDLILGIKPLDYDIVVPSDPGKFAQIVAKRLNGKVIVIGKDRFNVHRVISDTLLIDVTTLKNKDIHADLKSRDFTLNALAIDLSNNEIIDRVGGLKDLRERRVHMVSERAFRDDPLRLVRAFRMATVMDFVITPETLETITREAGAIRQSAYERIWAELQLILASPNSHKALQEMVQTEVLFHIIPELRALLGCGQNRFHTNDVFNHTMDAYKSLEGHLRRPENAVLTCTQQFIKEMPPKKRMLMKLAILLHDTGKPATRQADADGGIHFYGHAGQSARLTHDVCRRLRMANRQREWVKMVVQHHQRPLALFLSQKEQHAPQPKAIGRFFRQCGHLTPFILIHAIADTMGKETAINGLRNRMVSFYENLIETYMETITRSKSIPLVDGKDLMRHFGLQPSPLIGKLLRKVEELQMGGGLETHEQAMSWVGGYLQKDKKRSAPKP